MGSLIRWLIILLWLGLGVRELAAGPSTLEGCAPAIEARHAAERDALTAPDIDSYVSQLREQALKQQEELRLACQPTNGRL